MALTLTAYAARRGCSVKSVSRAIAAGRLVASVGRDDRGRPTIADPELADREWDANTQRPTSWVEQRVDRQGISQTPGESDGESDEDLKARVRRSLDDPELGRRAAEVVATTVRAHPVDDLPPGIPPLNTSRAIRAHALARRDTAHADLAELELAAKRGRLVDADAARADVEQAYTLAKMRLLRVPSDLAQRLPHLAAEVVPVLEELQRQALEELAAGSAPS